MIYCSWWTLLPKPMWGLTHTWRWVNISCSVSWQSVKVSRVKLWFSTGHRASNFAYSFCCCFLLFSQKGYQENSMVSTQMSGVWESLSWRYEGVLMATATLGIRMQKEVWELCGEKVVHSLKTKELWSNYTITDSSNYCYFLSELHKMQMYPSKCASVSLFNFPNRVNRLTPCTFK